MIRPSPRHGGRTCGAHSTPLPTTPHRSLDPGVADVLRHPQREQPGRPGALRLTGDPGPELVGVWACVRSAEQKMTGTPERIGRYTVAKELGSGGMGEV